MKNKKMILVIFLSVFLFIALFFVSIFIYSYSFNYDNEGLMFTTEDNRYSKEKIEKLEDKIYFTNMYVDYSVLEFNLEYTPECIRKTPFGYYAILICEDESLCFVFWSFENKIYSIYRTNGFLPSDEFKKSIIIGESTFKEMENSCFDFFGYPFSKTIATAHICTDGILVLKYDDNMVVKSIEFFSNEELENTNDDFLEVVPYILPKDKMI